MILLNKLCNLLVCLMHMQANATRLCLCKGATIRVAANGLNRVGGGLSEVGLRLQRQTTNLQPNNSATHPPSPFVRAALLLTPVLFYVVVGLFVVMHLQSVQTVPNILVTASWLVCLS